MNCEHMRETLLRHDWNESQRQAMRDALNHAAECESCRTAMRDFDGLRTAFSLRDEDAEPNDGWTAFEDRLSQSLATASRPRFRFTPIAMAASLALAVAGWGLYWQSLPGAAAPVIPSPDPHGTNAAVRFSPQEIVERSQVYRDVSEVFDGRAGWVFVSNGSSDVGLTTKAIPPQTRIVLLRLSMSRNDRVISTSDLMIATGQAAELSVPLDQGRVIQYHVAASEDTPSRLTIWAELQSRREAGQTIAALATELPVKPGETLNAGRMTTSSGGYELTASFAQVQKPGTSR